jgi:hypothetical protein
MTLTKSKAGFAITESATALVPKEKTLQAILRFVKWLDHYGELSYDWQCFYAGRLG